MIERPTTLEEAIRHIDDLRLRLKEAEEAEDKRIEAELEKYRKHLEELVTERTRELAESQRRATSILESISDGFLTFDTDWRLVYMNSEGERQMRTLTGRAREDLLGKNIWEDFPGMTSSEVLDAFHRAAEEQSPIVLEQFNQQAGRWFELRAFPSPDGLSVYSQDITDRKQAEEALRDLNTELKQRVAASTDELADVYKKVRAERQRLFDVLETLPVMICLLTPDYHIAFANRSFRRMFGEADGHCYDACFGNKEPCAFCESFRVLETGQPHDWEVTSPDGNLIMHAYDYPFTDVDGSPMILEMDVDITEQRKAEAELRRHRDRLEEMVKQRTEQLQDANDQLLVEITDRKQAEEELHRLNRTLRAQSKSAQAMMRATDESEYLWEVCRIIVEDTGESMVWIGYSEDHEAKTVRPVAYSGLEEGYLKTLNITWADTERGRGPAGTAIRTGQPSICRDMRTDPSYAPWREEATRRGYLSSVAIPLMADRKAFGILSIYSTEVDAFSEDEMTLLKGLADDLAFGIKALRLRAAKARAEEEASRARAEAEERAAQLESLVSSMADGVVLFDKESRILMLNDALRQLLGLPADLPLREVVEQYELQTLDGKPMPREDYPSARALKGEEIKDVRLKLVTPWRESIVSVSASPVRDPDGRLTGATVSSRHIGDRVDFERRQQELYERERHISQMLQQALIPPEIPSRLERLSIAARYQPALKEAEVGGDFYDIFELDDNRVGVLIGDVAGKGLAAAVGVAAARYAVRSYAYLDPSPSRVMTLVNDALCKEGTDVGQLLTAFYAVVDPSDGTMVYASAGHEPPVVCSAESHVEELSVTGPMLGIIPGTKYQELSRNLRGGDKVVMFTDGITEARHSGSVLFGKKGVIEHLKRACDARPEEIAEALVEAATVHAGGSLQDDVAIVVLRFERDR